MFRHPVAARKKRSVPANADAYTLSRQGGPSSDAMMDWSLPSPTARTVPRRAHRLLPAILVVLLLGVHATHLPLMLDAHGDPSGPISGSRGAAHDEGRVAPSWPWTMESAGTSGESALVRGALDVAAEGVLCLAESIATRPRMLLPLLLAVGYAALLASFPPAGAPWQTRSNPPPLAADRRRALLQVYLA